MEVYLDSVKNDLGGHKVIRAFNAVKQILGRQEELSDFVSKKMNILPKAYTGHRL